MDLFIEKIRLERLKKFSWTEYEERRGKIIKIDIDKNFRIKFLLDKLSDEDLLRHNQFILNGNQYYDEEDFICHSNSIADKYIMINNMLYKTVKEKEFKVSDGASTDIYESYLLDSNVISYRIVYDVNRYDIDEAIEKALDNCKTK